MKKIWIFSVATILLASLTYTKQANSFWGDKTKTLTPKNGILELPLNTINDGKAHHFKVRANDGTMVTFFTLKSRDGVIRAAIDACDVCYRSGKGYFQQGDFMVCSNCGQKFASNRINVIKGGCNPAPLKRAVNGKNLIIAMKDVNANSWYMKHRR